MLSSILRCIFVFWIIIYFKLRCKQITFFFFLLFTPGVLEPYCLVPGSLPFNIPTVIPGHPKIPSNSCQKHTACFSTIVAHFLRSVFPYQFRGDRLSGESSWSLSTSLCRQTGLLFMLHCMWVVCWALIPVSLNTSLHCRIINDGNTQLSWALPLCLYNVWLTDHQKKKSKCEMNCQLHKPKADCYNVWNYFSQWSAMCVINSIFMACMVFSIREKCCPLK